MALIDLSHALHDGLITYPGLPAPRITPLFDHAGSRGRYAPGTEFHIGQITMVANTGTYVDAPFHRFADGPDLAALPLERLADLPGLVVTPPPGTRAIDAPAFDHLPLAGRAVLVHTGWSAHFGTPAYGIDAPYLTRAAAERLVAAGVACAGIDALNIDDTADGSRPVHTLLLAAGIPIVEHLTNLAALPADGFRFFAVPVKVRGMGTFPVRAFAVI